jgi:hypothetical protein
MAIVSTGVALLLESGYWHVTWRAQGVAAFGVLAVLSAAVAATLLVRRHRMR